MAKKLWAGRRAPDLGGGPLAVAGAILAPALQAYCQLRCDLCQRAAAFADPAQLQHRSLVGQLDLALAIDQQHAGAHAADDQLVDLGHVGDLAAVNIVFGRRNTQNVRHQFKGCVGSIISKFP